MDSGSGRMLLLLGDIFGGVDEGVGGVGVEEVGGSVSASTGNYCLLEIIDFSCNWLS